MGGFQDGGTMGNNGVVLDDFILARVVDEVDQGYVSHCLLTFDG